jgi:oligopeptide transport system ATP-binding protein
MIQARNLSKNFSVGGGLFSRPDYVHAVDSVSFSVDRGETFGLVGESGCGKSTLGRLLIRLIEPTGGVVHFDGVDLTKASTSEMRSMRRRMQIVHQNPYAAIDPRMRASDVVAQPLIVHKVMDRRAARSRAIELLEQVGLTARHSTRYPHQLSGGQLQRVAIARAISLEPELLILDEPTSALDVSVQAQILRLLEELRAAHDLTYVFISHDLSVIRYISDTIGVMYLGRIVESGPARDVFDAPRHPYSRALLEAAPEPDFSVRKPLSVLEGNVPSALNPPEGCHFHERCPIAQPVCGEISPDLKTEAGGRRVACHFPLIVDGAGKRASGSQEGSEDTGE